MNLATVWNFSPVMATMLERQASTTPRCIAGTTSVKFIGTPVPPQAPGIARSTGLASTRILRPAMSSGLRIGLVLAYEVPS